jgi:hypothetical protein
MTPVSGGNLGRNILRGAASGALGGAIAFTSQANPVSREEVQEKENLLARRIREFPDRRIAEEGDFRDEDVIAEEWNETINGPRLEPEPNPYGTTEEQLEYEEFFPEDAEIARNLNRGVMRPVPPTAVRRTGTPGDTQFRTANDALRETLERHGIDPSTLEVQLQYGKNTNLVGPNNEPWGIVRGLNSEGKVIEFDHHPSGHYFEDTDDFELPHYHGPNKEHLTY